MWTCVLPWCCQHSASNINTDCKCSMCSQFADHFQCRWGNGWKSGLFTSSLICDSGIGQDSRGLGTPSPVVYSFKVTPPLPSPPSRATSSSATTVDGTKSTIFLYFLSATTPVPPGAVSLFAWGLSSHLYRLALYRCLRGDCHLTCTAWRCIVVCVGIVISPVPPGAVSLFAWGLSSHLYRLALYRCWRGDCHLTCTTWHCIVVCVGIVISPVPPGAVSLLAWGLSSHLYHLALYRCWRGDCHAGSPCPEGRHAFLCALRLQTAAQGSTSPVHALVTVFSGLLQAWHGGHVAD